MYVFLVSLNFRSSETRPPSAYYKDAVSGTANAIAVMMRLRVLLRAI